MDDAATVQYRHIAAVSMTTCAHASSHVVRTPYHRRKRLNVMTVPAIDSAPQVLAYT